MTDITKNLIIKKIKYDEKKIIKINNPIIEKLEIIFIKFS